MGQSTEARSRAGGRNGRIRVLHLITDSSPTEYFRLFSRHTDHDRFDMRVASVGSAGALQKGLAEIGVPTTALETDRRVQYPRAVVRLSWWLRRQAIDVLHAHLFDASLVGLLAARAAHTPLGVFTGHHSHEVPLYRRRDLMAVDRFAARRLAHVVVAPSPEMRDTFVTLYGCDPGNVKVIEHGVDFDRFDPQRTPGRALRAELGLEGKLVLGAISKHHWVKNLDALVEAFSSIAASREDAHLVILGIGDPAPLVSHVRKLGLAHRVSVLAPRADVPELLAAIDLFVHPALAESFGFAVVEAMAMAKPVVVRPVGIARDIVDDGVSGVLFTGTGPKSIREAIERALGWRERWPQLGAEARRRTLAFTPERWVQAHEQLYESRLACPQ